MAQVAYDFTKFEKEEPQKKPQTLKVVKGGNGRAKRQRQRRTIAMGSAFLLVTVMMFGLIRNSATLTELTTDIQAAQQELDAAKSQNDYLQSALEEETGVQKVEATAVDELGMMKLDKSQITYISMEKESTITHEETGMEKLWSNLKAKLLCVWQDIG